MDPGNLNATHDLDFFLNGIVQTTADLRDNNLHLKSENERLEGQLSEIMPVSGRTAALAKISSVDVALNVNCRS